MLMRSIEDDQDTFCGLDDLPTLPGVAIKILEKIRDPEASMHQLAEILATDPPLAAKVLHVANSPLFGLQNRVSNLPHAVNLLGEESLQYIALSFSLINLFDRKKIRPHYSRFWKESLTCAVVSRLIAKAIDMPGTEDLYFLGLIHNLGILVLAQSYPMEYARVLTKTRKQKTEFHLVESEVFGYNHMELGAFLIHSWGLPEKFFLPVLYHHHPEQISSENHKDRLRTRIVHLAVEINRFLHQKKKVRRLARIYELRETYELTERVQLAPLFEKVSEQIESLLPLFALGEYTHIDCLRLLEESKAKLINLSHGLTRKIKDQQQTIESLSLLATQDGLTKLKNYQSLLESLDNEIASSQRGGHTSVLALADLDAFKAVNDNYGHMAGDQVLQEVSRFFSENIRKSDVVARYGGEEFVFILSKTSVDEGCRILDRLREKMSDLKISYPPVKISVTMSVGVTFFSPGTKTSKEELLRQADSAMYIAKNTGGNRTVLYR